MQFYLDVGQILIVQLLIWNSVFTRFSMIRSCPQPKCLGRLACSQILYGERIEDFSPDCWLENHLHRFGGQPGTGFGIHDDDTDDDSITGSSDVEDSDSEHSAGTFSDLDNTLFLDRPRLHIEELFMSPEEVDADIDSPGGYRQVIELPPYCEMPNEPPPSYAEAVGLRYEEGSVSARSSSNGSTFLW